MNEERPPNVLGHRLSQTRRPASADRTARAANFRWDLEATYRRTLIDGYLESPFPTACLLYLKWSYLAKQCMALC